MHDVRNADLREERASLIGLPTCIFIFVTFLHNSFLFLSIHLSSFFFAFVFLHTLGVVLLGGVQVDALNVTGLVINTAGVVVFICQVQIEEENLRKVIPDEEAHHKKEHTPNQ